MMNLTQARRYGLEVTSCMKTETDRVYKVFDSETGKYLSKEWENMPTMNKTLNKELAKRMGYDYETLTRHLVYFGAALECEVGRCITIKSSLLTRSNNRYVNRNKWGIVSRNFEVSGITTALNGESRIEANEITLWRTK